LPQIHKIFLKGYTSNISGQSTLTSSIILLKKQLIIPYRKDVSGISNTTYRDLVGKPERKRQHGRSRSKWEENIKMYLREIGLELC
jgi:hypothetical protein